MASDGSATRKTGPPVDWNQFVSVSEGTTTPGAHAFTLAVKDNIVTLGTESDTTCASGMLQGYESPFEATVVAQMRSRGARVVGKTNLDEFGMGSHNLYSSAGVVQETGTAEAKSLSVGGSSGGSAVAVRLGDADVALGTDTGGSVRLPAAYGGIVGFKPSYGMLSRFGVVPYANSLDTVGLLAPDVGPIRQLIAGDGGLWKEHDARDPTSLSLKTRLRLAAQREGYDDDSESKSKSKTSTSHKQLPLAGLTFGIPLEYNIAELDPAIRAAWVAAAVQLRRLGATVSAVSLPSTRHALSSYYVLAPAEAASNMARYDGVRYGKMPESVGDAEAAAETVLYERARGAGLGREVQRRILLGAYVLSSTARDNYFLQAQRVRRLVVRDFDAVFRLQNPLRDQEDAETTNSEGYQGYATAGSAGEVDADADGHIDLSDLPEGLPLADKRGPARVDFLLCPTAPTPAPTLEDVVAAPSPVDAYINDVFTVPASLAGLPAISIPAPPVSQSPASTTFCPGLQLIGQFWDDARLLRVAEAVMEASFEHPGDRESLAKHRRTGTSQAVRE